MSEKIKPPAGYKLATKWERDNNKCPCDCDVIYSFNNNAWQEGHGPYGWDDVYTSRYEFAVPVGYEFPNKEPAECAQMLEPKRVAGVALSITQESTEFKPIVITIGTPEMMTMIVNECQSISDSDGDVYAIVELILNAAFEHKIIY